MDEVGLGPSLPAIDARGQRNAGVLHEIARLVLGDLAAHFGSVAGGVLAVDPPAPLVVGKEVGEAAIAGGYDLAAHDGGLEVAQAEALAAGRGNEAVGVGVRGVDRHLERMRRTYLLLEAGQRRRQRFL